MDDHGGPVTAYADAVVELAAEHLLLALELMAERDGIGLHRWCSRASLYVGQTHEGLAYIVRDGCENRRVSRELALAFVAQQKAGLVER